MMLSLAGLSPLTAQSGNSTDVVVIVHPNSTVETLSQASLRAIFGMRNRTWQGGQSVKVFVYEDKDPIHIEFTKNTLKTFPYNLRRIWERRIYSGTGQSPTTLSTQDEMVEMVSKTENAIGYISYEKVTDKVKVVSLK